MTMHHPFNQPLHFITPTYQDIASSIILSKKIDFKMDCYQPTQSFKIRGVGYAIQKAKAQGYEKIISSSGGNAGYAAAYAGLKLNLPVEVIVPKTTSQKTIDSLIKMKANVTVYGEVWDEANIYALNLCKDHLRYFYMHPFDHPDLWQGHASMIDEANAQLEEKPDAVILSVGGGGLLSGVAAGLVKNNWHHTDIIVVETIGASSLYQSIQAKKLVTLEKIESKASSLAAKTVSKNALEIGLQKNVHAITVMDESAQKACDLFLQQHKCLVELACGASLSVIYEQHEILAKYQKILVIVCGGINT